MYIEDSILDLNCFSMMLHQLIGINHLDNNIPII